MELPLSVPLTGADYFVCALDRQMRRAGLPGNVCRLVVRLEGGTDPARLAERLAGSEVLRWLARLRLTRDLPLQTPRWRAGGGPAPEILRLHRAGAGGAWLPADLPEHALRPDRCPALALDLVQGPRGTGHLVLTWHHALLDVRGAELLIGHLGGGPAPSAASAPAAHGEPRGWLRKLSFARESLACITAACGGPMARLGGGRAAGGGNRYRIHWFDEAETERVDEHARRLEADFRRSLFYLAASVKAVDGVARRRSGDRGDYVVPVPHDLRRRGAAGPLLSNQLSFLFFRVGAAGAGDLRATVGSLTAQMLEQVRGRTTESFRAAMELFRPAPLGFYLRQLGKPTGGGLATFFFSDAGESCPGLAELAGARPTAVTHLAPAADPPGLGVVFSRFRGRLCFVLSWVGEGLEASEVDRLDSGLAAALLGEEAP